jgi:DNA polymerase-3 subunit delta
MPIFTPVQIPKLIELAKKNRIAPVYIFIGPEHICREKAKEIYTVLQEKEALLEVYNLNDKEEKKAFSKIKGYQESLFGIRKVYLILGAENISYEKGEEIAKSLGEKNNLFSWFLIASGFEESHPLYKYALEKGAIIPFTTKKEEDILETELIMSLKSAGKIMDKQTASLFISLVGRDYHHFKNELEKLILYTEDREMITEDDIWMITIPLESDALYLLADTFFNYGPEKAYKLVLNLLDHKIEPPQILWYLYKFFKRMQIFKEFLARHPELAKEEKYLYFSKKLQEIKDNPVEEIPKIIAESHPYPLFNIKRHLKKVKDFKMIFEELYRADLSIKRDFRNPARVFNELFLSLWQLLEKSKD